jgi:DNA primase large subunit
MPSHDEELRRELLEETEAIIDRLLANKKPAEEITLTDIEQIVLAAGRQFQAVLTERLAEKAEAVGEVVSECPTCGNRLRHKGYRSRRVVTETGEVTIKRAYYYCEHCRKGIFPPG